MEQRKGTKLRHIHSSNPCVCVCVQANTRNRSRLLRDPAGRLGNNAAHLRVAQGPTTFPLEGPGARSTGSEPGGGGGARGCSSLLLAPQCQAPSLSGHTAARAQDANAARCGHVTRFWPRRCWHFWKGSVASSLNKSWQLYNATNWPSAWVITLCKNQLLVLVLELGIVVVLLSEIRMWSMFEDNYM